MLVLIVFSVTIYQKAKGDESRNKRTYCYYCDKSAFNMEQHLASHHMIECPVRLAVKAREKGDNMPMKRIIAYGVFNHNMDVLKKGEGIFMVCRSSNVIHYVEDYLPCKFCQGFCIKRELYRHCQRCNLREDGGGNKYIMDGRLMLDGALMAESIVSKELHSKVISRMRYDKLTKVIKNNSGIMKFGLSLLQKLGPKRANDIAQRMRQVARIGVRLVKTTKSKPLLACNINSFLTGESFDQLIEAISEECESFEDDDGRKLFRNPNLALKLGHSILKMAKLKLGQTIRTRDLVSKAQTEDLIILFAADFTDRVSTPAHAAVRIRPKTLQEFPDSTDLEKLKSYVAKRGKVLCDILESEANSTTWRLLAELTLSRLLIYNARRSSEISDLKVVEYECRSNAAHSIVKDNMSEDELQLLNR